MKAWRARITAPDGTALTVVCTKHPVGERRLKVETFADADAAGPPPSLRDLARTLHGAYCEKLRDVEAVLRWKGVSTAGVQWEEVELPEEGNEAAPGRAAGA
ncbi:MAG: hypothetical protein HY704_09350 [Gemmatimonadetes bacterium]|nr:hypothetical protein [Gemmatimonadota bacterium]